MKRFDSIPTRACTVFIIDDDPIQLQLLSRMVWLANIIPTVKTFTSGEDSLDFISQNIAKKELLPDYIFLDVNMPGMDGWQFLTSLGLLKKDIAKKFIVYMLSASDDEQDMAMVKEFPEVKKYLMKPAKKVEVIKALE